MFFVIISFPHTGKAEKVVNADKLHHVVLQLPWHHQFQFAGYYAAAEKGYYKDAGLNVTIKSGQPGLRPVPEVLDGHADYGVAPSEILLHRLNGKPIVALAAIFQHSAIVFLTKQDSGISTPQDMVGRTVMLLPGDDAAEYKAVFHSEGISQEQINIINDLIEGKTDVFNAYLTNEPFYLQEENIPFSIIKPITYGIDFYGDTLFTSEQKMTTDLEQVKAFRRASLRGWEYALTHSDEIIDLLIKKYGVNKSLAHLRFEADAVDKLILPNIVKIGHMNQGRWRHMAETYVQLGMTNPDYSLEGFIYDPDPPPDYTWIRRLAISAVVIFAVAGVLILIIFNHRLNKRILKRTEELHESQNNFQRVLENAPLGILIADKEEKRFQYANPSICKMLGYDREEIKKMGVQNIHPAEDVKCTIDEFDAVAQEEKKVAENIPCLRNDGTLFNADIFIASILYEGKKSMVGFFIDTTERNRQVVQRIETTRQKEQLKKLESLKTMAGAIAHRFNNAMMAVQGNLDLLTLTLPGDSEEYKMAKDATQAAKGASQVGTMMLSYVGQRQLKLHKFPIVDLVRESVTALKNLFLPAISLKFSQPAHPLYCSMDQQQIKEVIESILINAIESLEDSAGTIEISFGTGSYTARSFPVPFQDDFLQDGMFTFCQIKDSGHGINPENLSQIFEPFYTTRFVGRGLGLALTVGIMQRHHGAITVESSPDKGTTVRMLLPSISSTQQTIPSSDDTVQNETVQLSGDILLADDEKTVLEVGCKLLEALGFTVHTSMNGKEAEYKVRKKDIDFVAAVLDISMPEMDGIEAMKAIRKINPALPILLSSGYSEDDFSFNKDQESKPDGFLAKPFQLSDMRSSLETILS